MVLELISASFLSELFDDDDENKIVFQFAVGDMVLKLMSERFHPKIYADDHETRAVPQSNVFIIVSE